ncbi:MAG: S8 family serine peptidase [Gammaproteobacteria bacterium]|nr:S8 family serine peptidase [Gammaproteobacteria bacterium]NNM13759.1 S8 family serine peptidase [Gammaproteobacteria bacterium]
MNNSLPILKSICIASLIAMGMSVQAEAPERYIVKHDKSPKANSLKKEFKNKKRIKVEGDDWFAIELDEAGKKALKTKGGIKSIEIDPKRFPMAIYNDSAGDPNVTQVTPYGYFQAQADQVNLQSSGVKVCVIDSGIAGKQGETGGRNNDFDWGVITGDNDSGTGDWDADGGPHGTHVAGTVGAEDNNFGVIGMAPGVPMHIIKVFNDAGWGYSSDLAHAANLCAAAGANVINMSLGGGGANSTEENAFENFVANDGLVLAAAGNSGNSIRSYPAGYDAIVMVGAVDADNNIASFSQYPSCNTAGTNCVELSAGGVSTLSTVPSGGGVNASLVADGTTYSVNAMENEGNATAATYNFGLGNATDNGADGKICIIERGNISFHDKTLNCENSGGIGAVIYNNQAGNFNGTLGATNNTSIPVVSAAQADGPDLLNSSTATVDVTGSAYDYFSGTSMATPTAAGVAALVWSNYPDCTGEDIRDALKASAEDQGSNGPDRFYGHGIVKAKAAYDFLATSACGGTPPVNEPPVASFSATCNDLACDFDASGSTDTNNNITSYAWDYGDGNTDSGVSRSHTFSEAGTYSVTLTVTDSDGASDSTSQTVTVNEPVPNVSPTASFTVYCTDLDCTFTDSSSDSDGTIASHSWSFGDGGSSTSTNPNHSYAAEGTYTVVLTVTDDGGLTDTFTNEEVTVTTSNTPQVPAAPTNLTANSVKEGKGKKATIISVTLNWTDNADNEDGFVVERCIETGKGKSKSCIFASYATVGANIATYTDTNPESNVKYRVKAFNGTGDSAYTNTIKP